MERPEKTGQMKRSRLALAAAEAELYSAFDEYATDCGMLVEDRPLQYLKYRMNEMKGAESSGATERVSAFRSPLSGVDIPNATSGLDQRLLEFTRRDENLGLQLDLGGWYPVIWRSYASLRTGTRIVEQQTAENPLGTLWLFEGVSERCGVQFERRLFDPAFDATARRLIEILTTQPPELVREFLPENTAWDEGLEEFWLAFPELVECLQCISFAVGGGCISWTAEAEAGFTVLDPLAGFTKAFHFCSVIAGCVQFFAQRWVRECPDGIACADSYSGYDEESTAELPMHVAVEAFGQMAYWMLPRDGEDPSCLIDIGPCVYNPLAGDVWGTELTTATYLRRVGDARAEFEAASALLEYPPRRLRSA